jgi:DNA-binding CsgD family transcriptional regulator
MTEKEQINTHLCGLFKLDQMLSAARLTLNDLYNDLPGWLHLNDYHDMGLRWMSGSMENDLKISSRKVAEQGPLFLQNIIHYDSTHQVVPRLKVFQGRGDKNRVIGFMQMIRRDQSQPYLPYYTSVKLSQELGCFICQTVPLKEIENHAHVLMKLMDFHALQKESFTRFQQLTKREKEILQMVAQGHTNRNIGEMLCISPFTVKTHRQNILRKLEVSRLHELIRIAMAHGLV